MTDERIETPDSKNIVSYGYSPTRSVFIVEFKNGSTWEYDKVPEQLFEDAKKAASIGSFFHARIKGYYDGRKIS